jgi:hypothetical protein
LHFVSFLVCPPFAAFGAAAGELGSLGDIRIMTIKSKFRVAAILFLIVTTCIWAADLEKFAQKIAATDRVVVSPNFVSDSLAKTSVTLTGEDAKLVARAVSAGKIDRLHYHNIFSVRVEFCQGTNVLGDILTDGTLFLADGTQYRDSSNVLSHLVEKLDSK